MSRPNGTVRRVVEILFVLAMAWVVVACATAGSAPGSGATANAATASSAAKAQTNCPVMGDAINKSLYVDRDGKRIYVCCSACVKIVKKDFDKYAKKLEAQGVDLTLPLRTAEPAQ